MKSEITTQHVKAALGKLEAALNGRLMRDGVNRNEGGFNFYPDYEKIKDDVEEARNILSVLLQELEK